MQGARTEFVLTTRADAIKDLNLSPMESFVHWSANKDLGQLTELVNLFVQGITFQGLDTYNIFFQGVWKWTMCSTRAMRVSRNWMDFRWNSIKMFAKMWPSMPQRNLFKVSVQSSVLNFNLIIFSSPNTCSCNSGYTRDIVDQYQCNPVCNPPCENAICSQPNMCLCRQGSSIIVLPNLYLFIVFFRLH